MLTVFPSSGKNPKERLIRSIRKS